MRYTCVLDAVEDQALLSEQFTLHQPMGKKKIADNLGITKQTAGEQVARAHVRLLLGLKARPLDYE